MKGLIPKQLIDTYNAKKPMTGLMTNFLLETNQWFIFPFSQQFIQNITQSQHGVVSNRGNIATK